MFFVCIQRTHYSDIQPEKHRCPNFGHIANLYLLIIKSHMLISNSINLHMHSYIFVVKTAVFCRKGVLFVPEVNLLFIHVFFTQKGVNDPKCPQINEYL